MKMNNQELKPCPFCGGEVELVNFIEKCPIPVNSACYAKCKKCNARTEIFQDINNNFEYMQQAIDAWNRRVGNE